MNERKLRNLLGAAKKESAPVPEAGFEQRVMAAIAREQPVEPWSLLDQLGQLFPRLAVAAAVIIGLCVAVEFYASASGQPDLLSGTAQLSDQWLFTTKGF